MVSVVSRSLQAFSILAVNSWTEAKRYLSWRVEAMEDGPDLLTNFGGKPIEGMK